MIFGREQDRVSVVSLKSTHSRNRASRRGESKPVTSRASGYYVENVRAIKSEVITKKRNRERGGANDSATL